MKTEMFLFIALLGFYCRLLSATDPESSGTAHNRVSPREYCNMEAFNASCRPGHVLMMESARYGRMNIGRCVRGSYGYLGCAADARRFMDARCSGRRYCRFIVPDPVMYAMQPCPPDFTSYLEASYSCVEAYHGDKLTCDRSRAVRVTTNSRTSGYFTTSPPSIASTSSVDVDRGPGSASCPWVIEAQRGQRLNITLYNFADTFVSASSASSPTASGTEGSLNSVSSDLPQPQRAASANYGGPSASHTSSTGSSGYGPMRPDVCIEIATVIDGEFGRKTVTVCGEDRREMNVLLSRSHVVRIELTNIKLLQSLGAFVFHYRVTGCADVKLIGDMWQLTSSSQSHLSHPYVDVQHHLQQQHSQHHQQVVLRCNATDETWHMTCRDGQWVGEVGNCSTSAKGGWSLEHMINQESSFPVGVLLAVTIGVAMGVVIGGIMLCLLTMYMKRHRRNLAGYSQPKEQRDTYVGFHQHISAATAAAATGGLPPPPPGPARTPPAVFPVGIASFGYHHPQPPSPYSSTSSTATGSAAFLLRRTGSIDPSSGTYCGGGSSITTTKSNCSGFSGGTSAVLTTFGQSGNSGNLTGNTLRHHVTTYGGGIGDEATDDLTGSIGGVFCGSRLSGGTGTTTSGDMTSSTAYIEDVIGLQTIVPASPFSITSSGGDTRHVTTSCIGTQGTVLPSKNYVYSTQLST